MYIVGVFFLPDIFTDITVMFLLEDTGKLNGNFWSAEQYVVYLYIQVNFF